MVATFDNGNVLITVDVDNDKFFIKVKTPQRMEEVSKFSEVTFDQATLSWVLPRTKVTAMMLKYWTGNFKNSKDVLTLSKNLSETNPSGKNPSETIVLPIRDARPPIYPQLSTTHIPLTIPNIPNFSNVPKTPKKVAQKSKPVSYDNDEDNIRFKKNVHDMIVKPIHRNSQLNFRRESSPRKSRPVRHVVDSESEEEEDVIDNVNMITIAKDLSSLRKELSKIKNELANRD